MSKREQRQAAKVSPPAMDEFAELRIMSAMADALMGRSRLANVSGKTFGGRRDIYETCGYDREITPIQYRSRYKRNAVAKRVVECVPQDTWRGGFELVEDQDIEKDTKFEKAWTAFAKRLKLVPKFKRADILSRIGRYSVMVVGAPGKEDTPLIKCTEKNLKYVALYAEDEAKVSEYDSDLKSERYGQPIFYEVKRPAPGSLASKSAPTARKVHYTRVHHMADGLLEDTLFGTPALECVWNLLDDLEKITGGGAESFWLRANQGMHIDIDPSFDPSTEQLAAMREDIEKYRHKIERVLRTRGTKISMLGSDVADIKGPQAAIVEQISAGTGVPTRVLMGSEQGKLAADQDSVKYYRMCEGRRVEFAEEHVRAFVDWMIRLGVLPAPQKDGGEYEVRFGQIRTRDEDEQAALAQKWAGLNQAAGETVVTGAEIREHCLDLEPLDEDNTEEEQALEDAFLGINQPKPEDGKQPKTAMSKTLRAAIRAAVGAPEKEAPHVHVHVKSGKKRILRDAHGALTGVEDVE